MAKKIIKAQMKQRLDTKANWAAQNPVLLAGELGIVSDDPNLYKVGDGATAWNGLPFRGFDGTLVHTTGDSETAAMSQKGVTEKLTELDQEVGELDKFVQASDIKIFSAEDVYKYPVLSRIKSVSYSTESDVVVKCTQIYMNGTSITVVLNKNDVITGSIYEQTYIYNFAVNTGTQEQTKYMHGLGIAVQFDTDNYSSLEDIQVAQVEKGVSLYVTKDYMAAKWDKIRLKGLDKFAQVSGLGIFAVEDVYRYTALGRIKSISYDNYKDALVEKISVLQINAIDTTGNNIVVNVTIDGGILIPFAYTPNSGIVSKTLRYTNAASVYNGTYLTVEFDTDSWDSSEGFYDQSIPVSAEYFCEMVGYAPSIKATNSAIDLLGHDFGTALNKGDIESVDMLRGFRRFSAWSSHQLYLTYINIGGTSGQLIINKGLRVSGDIYTQDVVVNATITEGVAVFHYDVSDTKIYAEYVLDGQSYQYNAQRIEQTTAKKLPLLHLQTLSLYDSDKVFQTLEEFKKTSLRRGHIGNTPFMKAPNAICNLEDSRTLESSTMYILNEVNDHNIFGGIDKNGKFLFWSNAGNQIFERESYESAENVKYRLTELNATFANEMRGLLVLPNNNLLIHEDTAGNNIGGLWVLDRRDADNVSLVKVFTYRNGYHTTRLDWSIAMVDNIVYLGEYGNSSSSSGIGTKGDATRLYKSEDYGMTWKMLYDFKNLDNNIIPDKLHVHSLFWDRYYQRLWVNIGDDTTEDGKSSIRTCWSDDGGLSWKSKSWRRWFGEENNNLNNIKGLSMYVAKDFILMGGDDYQNCMYRSIRMIDDVILEPVYRYNNYRDRVTQFTSRFKMLSNGLIVVALIHGDSLPHQTRVVGTFDGIKWYTLFSGIQENVNISSPNFGILEEYDGKVYFDYTTRDDNNVYKRHLVQFELPKIME